jgi:hypothetical protein
MQSSSAQIHIDDETVEVFVPESEARYVVIATLDKDGRPSKVVRWNPEQHRFDALSSDIVLKR